MALRLDDADGLARATSAFLEVIAGGSGPISSHPPPLDRRPGLRRWTGATSRLRRRELDALGYRYAGRHAFADAAFLAARAGRASDAEARAMAIAAEIGLHPSLGPLPETRWVQARSAESR